MNREYWKAMLPIITAFCEGKTVQTRLSAKDPWEDSDNEDFDFNESREYYRIKPEPKLRPWRPEEVPVGAVVRSKGDRLIKSVILSVFPVEGDSGYVRLSSHRTIEFGLSQFVEAWELLYGSPCGVSEVSE